MLYGGCLKVIVSRLTSVCVIGLELVRGIESIETDFLIRESGGRGLAFIIRRIMGELQI